MMHNSLFIQDVLRGTNLNPLHKERRNPHRWLQAALPFPDRQEGEVILAGAWTISGDRSIAGMREAIDDFGEFLQRFGVRLESSSGNRVLFIREEMESGHYKLVVHQDRIEVRARDMKGIWAGLVFMEKEMAMNKYPALQERESEHVPLWNVQISQAPYGSNYLVPDLSAQYLSDDAFRMLAHYGINGMTLYGDWLCYVKSKRFPELNCEDYDSNIATLRDAVQRAKKYGVDLYYVPVSPKFNEDHPLFHRLPQVKGSKIVPGQSGKKIHCLCSSSEENLKFTRETMANLFTEIPDLGGLILIIGGESYYHCFMRPDKSGLPEGVKTSCPQCAGKRPEDVVNGLLKATAEAVHDNNSEAKVMAWPYSAFTWSSDPAQLKLLEGMSRNIGLLTTIDKDQWMQKDGYKKKIWDYSIDYTGPADNTINQAAAIRKRDMRLYIKNETALGLECIQFPYVPSIQRIGEKWQSVRSMEPEGVLQSWMFFGMWGSRAEELGWWTAWHPELSVSEVVDRIARRDFGDNAARLVVVWAKMSEAVSHLPCIPQYFTGPGFIGPAHPLLFDPDEPVPDLFHALLYYLQENEESFSDMVIEAKHSLVTAKIPLPFLSYVIQPDQGQDLMDLVIGEYGLAVSAARQAAEIIAGLEPPADLVGAEILREERVLVGCIYRTFRSTWNTMRFLHTRDLYLQDGQPGMYEALLEIAKDELENARQAKPLFEDAPWLDLSLRVDGKFPSSLQMIDAKIKMLEAELLQRSAKL